MTTDLNPEGLERAAEALHNEKYPAWLWGTNEELQQHYRGHVTAAVTAYLGHTEVTTVEAVALLPDGSIIMDADGDAFQRSGKTNYSANWYPAGHDEEWMASHIALPATVLHRPAP